MEFQYNNIPDELKQLKQWVCWSGSKLPKNPRTGGNAMSNNPSTWGTYFDALEAVKTHKFDGIGFMFAPPYFGVDLDKCIGDDDFVDEFVDTLQSYTEYSKSGTGIHIICRGSLPTGARRKGSVEMYSEGRFFIMTGNVYRGLKPIEECTETIKILHAKYLSEPQSTSTNKAYEKLNMEDDEVLELARSAANGALFATLFDGIWQGIYNSQSEADLALCNALAFWTQRDYQQMDRLFRASRLYRKKWDENRGGLTYGQKTLERAIANCGDVYRGHKNTSSINVNFRPKKDTTEYREFELTDTGNGQRFAWLHGDILRYMRNRKKWYFWDGKSWCEDTTDEVRRLADKAIAHMKKQAFALDDEEAQAALLKYATRTAGSKPKDNMISEAQHLDGIAIDTDYFDTQEDMINMQNGVINLRNGEVIKHSSDCRMSKIGYADCAKEGKPKRWLQFIDEITGGDKGLARYLQKAVGYTLTASIKEQCAFFCYGNGCNGKSTFIDVISTILGKYCVNMQAESIMIKKNQSSANSDIARLKGARMVTVSEPEEGVKLNESLVKQMTGGDPITARFLFGDEFEFKPQFKLWICTNHKPVIRGTDDGIWRRIVLIPFTVKIAPDKIDRGLGHKLRKELPLIARWAVEGAIMWQQEGLEKPTCIQRATDEYRSEMDVLSKFCTDCIEDDDDPNSEGIKAGELYEIYKAWAKDTNEYEVTATRFGKEFTQRYGDKTKTRDGLFYRGCKLSYYATVNYKGINALPTYTGSQKTVKFPYV